jgi:hypothetical protein
MTIGGQWTNLHQGTIKVARVMNRAVSAQEVLAMYSLFNVTNLRPVKPSNPTTDLIYWTAGPAPQDRSIWSPTAEYVGYAPNEVATNNAKIGVSGLFDMAGNYQVRALFVFMGFQLLCVLI